MRTGHLVAPRRSGYALALALAACATSRGEADDLRPARVEQASAASTDLSRAARPIQKPIAPLPGYFGQLRRNGITWTFAQPARCGRYVNGDWWVVGPVELVAIAPGSSRDGDTLSLPARQGFHSLVDILNSEKTEFR